MLCCFIACWVSRGHCLHSVCFHRVRDCPRGAAAACAALSDSFICLETANDGHAEPRCPDGPFSFFRVLQSSVGMLAISARYPLHGPLFAVSEDLAALEVLAVSFQGGQQTHRFAAYELGKLSNPLWLCVHVVFATTKPSRVSRSPATTTCC